MSRYRNESYKLSLLIERIQGLPQAMLEGAADDIATAIKAELTRTIKARQTPDGVPWALRKVGTRPVLVHAAAALSVAAVGVRILVRLTGIEAKHNYGAVRGGTKRQMIPRGAIPPALLAVMRAVLDKHFAAAAAGKAA